MSVAINSVNVNFRSKTFEASLQVSVYRFFFLVSRESLAEMSDYHNSE